LLRVGDVNIFTVAYVCYCTATRHLCVDICTACKVYLIYQLIVSHSAFVFFKQYSLASFPLRKLVQTVGAPDAMTPTISCPKWAVWAGISKPLHTFALTNSVAPEPEGSSPHSQQPASGPYPEPGESTPHTPPNQSP
jgi:hypothetical protein